VPERKPITDQNGVTVRVSALGRNRVEIMITWNAGRSDCFTTTELTPEQALDLAEWLKEAAEARL
jgi:hypothetical protein